MWLLDILPDIFFHILLVVGGIGVIAGFLLTFVPFIGTYRLPIQVIGTLIFSVALWFQGGIAKDAELKIKIAELERDLAEARALSNAVNTEVLIKYVNNTKTIRERGETIETIIYRDPEISRFECQLPESAIKVHNAAATGNLELLAGLNPGLPIDVTKVNEAASAKIKLAPKK